MRKITMRRKGIGAAPDNSVTHTFVARMRRSAVCAIALLTLLPAAIGYGQEASLVEQIPEVDSARMTIEESAPALAFGKYLASLQERNLFTESGRVSMEIDASLPGLAKEGRMFAVRHTNDSERSEYSDVRLDGDSTVKHEVIARYLAAAGASRLPYSSVAVTPANYKFRYAGSVETKGTAVYIFQITPKTKRTGLIRGQIWIDSTTGIAVHQVGRFVKQPSVFIRRIEVSRDVNLREGLPCVRVTNVAIYTRLMGRAELKITEQPLPETDSEVAQQLITQGDVR
jgi:hypothetical protein